jgi:hypothetical protein
MHRLRVTKKGEFLECLGTDVYREIEHDTKNARELGFESPPAFVAEGIPSVGTPSAVSLARMLEQGLKAQLQRTPEFEEGSQRRKRPKAQRARRPKKPHVNLAPSTQQQGKEQLRQQSVPPPLPQREKLFDVE